MKNGRSNQLPKARKEQLIVKELPDEVLIYDLARDKAHCLNQTAALVWKNCDGNTSITEINASLAEESGAPVDERVVWLALDQLEKFNLLADAPAMPVAFNGLNRRQLIRTLGMAAAALPVIITMAAPTRAQVGSCLAPGTVVPGGCTPTTNCCSGTCKNPSQCN
jgi:hypothetical protein